MAFSEKYLNCDANIRKYGNYKKYLVFDCDAPPDIQKIIKNMTSSHFEFELLLSNSLFETWLLMHFENVDEKLSNKAIYERLSRHLSTTYSKANAGIIREILSKGNVEDAITHAEKLLMNYESEGKSIHDAIADMNPYTNVHTLTIQFLAAIT